MVIKIFKNFLKERQRKKMLIKSSIERKKMNFVFRFLLTNYEKQTEGQVDIPAFEYALADIRKIRRLNKINEAYDYAKKVLEEEFKKKDNTDIDLQLKEEIQYDADWAELQAERDEAILWGV